MKRFAAIALVVLLIASLFVGCSGSKVEGAYKIKTINDKSPKDYFKESFAAILGEDFDLASLGMTDEVLDNLMSITLKEDGTCSFSSNFDGEEEVGNGTWKQEGDKVIITVDDKPQEFTLKDGNLVATMEEDGETMTMVLAKD